FDAEQRVEKTAVTWKCCGISYKEECILRISALSTRLRDHTVRQIDADYDSSGCALSQHSRGPSNPATQIENVIVLIHLHQFDHLSRNVPMALLHAASAA